jgi:hypothetical protein
MKKRMMMMAVLCLAAAPHAYAQREVEASNADPFRAATQSQSRGRNSTDRLGTESSTRDMLPAADRAQAERMMRSFAQCVVRGDDGTARRLLAVAAGSAEERPLMARIVSRRSACLTQGQLRMKGDWMRGAIAEQLYLQSYPQALDTPSQPDAPVAAARGENPYRAYARCVAARNGPAVDAVLRAAPGSDAEKAAYRQTMPTLSSCIAGGEAARLEIDRTALRGFLAEALYRQRAGQG